MVELADIMRQYGKAYGARYGNRMLPSHQRAIDDIINCRTSVMGGQVYQCPEHEKKAYKYHSCMNRNCPKCQNKQAQQWLEKERSRLVNVRYFFMTVTLPEELRPLARSHQKLVYKLLFTASWKAMKKLAHDPRFIGGLIGALAVLHTWTRTLMYHPHIHYLLPAGGVSDDYSTWLPAQQKFFLPVKALSKIFRAMMRDALKEAAPELFAQIPSNFWYKDWVVHCKPVGNGAAVLKYFAPYIFRVAISNKRIIKLKKDQVTFVYKHSKTKQWQPVTLQVFEFIRRFLQHVLPKGFKKVRHFGFLNSKNKHLLAILQYILGTVKQPTEAKTDTKPKIPCCPICGKEMILIDILPPERVRFSKIPLAEKEQNVPP